jgi:CspA family cold shock protein
MREWGATVLMGEEGFAGDEVAGRVKWFDPGKGFGFVVSDSGGPDILLHANVLRNFGQGSVADGAGIRLRVQHTPRGLQAVEVLEIVAPEGAAAAGFDDMTGLDAAAVAALPLAPSRVKWFDKGKGFGFANVFGSARDVFVHIEILRRSGLADLQPGEAVALKVAEGRRGLMAVEVAAWEKAIRSEE